MFIKRNGAEEEPSMNQSNSYSYYCARAATSRELAHQAMQPGIAAWKRQRGLPLVTSSATSTVENAFFGGAAASAPVINRLIAHR